MGWYLGILWGLEQIQKGYLTCIEASDDGPGRSEWRRRPVVPACRVSPIVRRRCVVNRLQHIVDHVVMINPASLLQEQGLNKRMIVVRNHIVVETYPIVATVPSSHAEVCGSSSGGAQVVPRLHRCRHWKVVGWATLWPSVFCFACLHE